MVDFIIVWIADDMGNFFLVLASKLCRPKWFVSLLAEKHRHGYCVEQWISSLVCSKKYESIKRHFYLRNPNKGRNGRLQRCRAFAAKWRLCGEWDSTPSLSYTPPPLPSFLTGYFTSLENWNIIFPTTRQMFVEKEHHTYDRGCRVLGTVGSE
ncbi:hypothetical protein CEXT_47501 [Caerostris extrusa]|uniref:Uncharacterized protein n=1 Tax=Caerostris extrusa TaxID=172846 RepID=A0AAV4VKC5_CAEEX|nr:hypothetical protein CEXT_47501 [Caerostris extrusa]